MEVIISSYHGAAAYQDEMVHGFILVYSTKRRASLNNLKWVTLGTCTSGVVWNLRAARWRGVEFVPV